MKYFEIKEDFVEEVEQQTEQSIAVEEKYESILNSNLFDLVDNTFDVEQADYLLEKKQELCSKLDWFSNVYDVQVLQVQRAMRLGEEWSYSDYVLGKTYNNINELDSEATLVASQIKNLRTLFN